MQPGGNTRRTAPLDSQQTPIGSRGLRLVSDMRARTKALQARLGNHIPTFATTDGLPASRTTGGRGRKSLGLSISGITRGPRRKDSKQSIKTNNNRLSTNDIGQEVNRASMDSRGPSVDEDRLSILSTTTAGSPASNGWDSLSDVIGMSTPRAPRVRSHRSTDNDQSTKATIRAQNHKSSPRNTILSLSPVSEATHSRQQSVATVIGALYNRQPTTSSPSSFRLSMADDSADREPAGSPQPWSTHARRPSTALAISSSVVNDEADRSQSGIRKLRHKRSVTLGGLGEWGQGLRNSLGAFSQGIRTPRSSHAPPTPGTDEALDRSESSIPPLPERIKHYGGLPSSSHRPTDTMAPTAIGSRKPFKPSRRLKTPKEIQRSDVENEVAASEARVLGRSTDGLGPSKKIVKRRPSKTALRQAPMMY